MNIRAIVISPEPVDTTEDLDGYPQGGIHETSDIPVGCLGTVDDIASACLFPVTGQCGFMTAQTLHVNGETNFF